MNNSFVAVPRILNSQSPVIIYYLFSSKKYNNCFTLVKLKLLKKYMQKNITVQTLSPTPTTNVLSLALASEIQSVLMITTSLEHSILLFYLTLLYACLLYLLIIVMYSNVDFII